jgi:hypothetical protein
MCDFTNFVDGRFYAYFGALSGKTISMKILKNYQNIFLTIYKHIIKYNLGNLVKNR